MIQTTFTNWNYMSLKIGIVGLPNVGKSTLFNALIKGSHAEAANYPFCTIEPNVGIVEVPDERLKPLAEISKSKKIVPAVVEFVDIAGLVKGASEGEGLGNKFLAHIRECAAIAMVVRFFEDEKVIHVSDKLNPEDDIATIETELQLSDLQTIEKLIFNTEKDKKAGLKEANLKLSAMNKIKTGLDLGKNARDIALTDDEKLQTTDFQLLTNKPVIYIANCSEDQLIHFNDVIPAPSSVIPAHSTTLRVNSGEIQDNKGIPPLADSVGMTKNYHFIPISAKIESELNELDEAEKAEYLEGLGISDTGINRLVKEAYRTIGLMTYLTTGEMETRAWTTPINSTAPQAAGVIHTDFERGFIAAEVATYKDFIDNNGWSGARTRGLVRTEGKTYIVKDGDIMLFRFNV
jgi:ribosome-binding ATPase YchF (GTP1/OBG family)